MPPQEDLVPNTNQLGQDDGGIEQGTIGGVQPDGDESLGTEPQDGKSQFDTNFDAGVEADEDTDPKKYIQQLTGKLSTTLHSFNNENDDEGLNKYVAKMIVKQTTKNLGDAAKKDIIKAINTSNEPDAEDKKEKEIENDGESSEKEQIQEMIVKKETLVRLNEELKKRLKK